MAIDILTGVISSAIERKVSSKIAYRGFEEGDYHVSRYYC